MVSRASCLTAWSAGQLPSGMASKQGKAAKQNKPAQQQQNRYAWEQ